MQHLDGETIVKRIEGQQEAYIPLHTTDMVDFLAQHPALGTENEQPFRMLASLILSLLHHLYRQRHEQLTYLYAPLDPDRDRQLMSVPTPESRERLCSEMGGKIKDVLARANYRRLGTDEIQTALEAASQWGVRMRVNFAAMKKLEVYTRGGIIGQRSTRPWLKFFRKVDIEVPLYQRLVVVFQTVDEPSTTEFDPRRLYLRMFKNVPQQDIDMMLPATGIQMSWLDHSRIVVPSLYAAAMSLWRVLRNVVVLALFGVFKTVALFFLVLFAIGFGIKSMFTYRTNTKRRYMLNMAQSLYYQNLDNNAGVLLRLLEEGEQQEASEAVLAYFVLSTMAKDTEARNLVQIDQACEELLLEITGWKIDFDVEATVKNLVHLGIVVADKQGWRALPIEEAADRLDRTWDSWFSRR